MSDSVQPHSPSLPLSVLGAPRDVPTLRREPYRLLFPMGALFAVIGTLPWLLFATGALTVYPRTFHALVQVQSFLACFIGGFLMTFVPRRTGAEPPRTWELTLAVALPCLLAAAAGLGRVALAELFWLAWLLVLGRFVLVRFLHAPTRPVAVPSMVWIPLSLAAGVLGTLAAAATAMMGRLDLHALAHHLVLQGMVCGLIMGVGGLLLPVLLNRASAGAQRLPRIVHVMAALLFFASYPLEVYSVRWTFAVRALITALVLVYGAKLWAPPRQTGAHVVLAWLGAWALPLGHAFVAVSPERRVSGLHIVFLGGFAMMAFAIGAHVAFAHGNRPDLLKQRFTRSLLLPFAVAMAVALVARAGLEGWGPRYLQGLGVGVAAFLTAVVCWALAVLPVAFRPPRSSEPSR